MELKRNTYSHLTAKDRKYLSFPSKWLLNNDFLKGAILDFGCGYGVDVSELLKTGLNIKGYDPHYFPEKVEETFDVILCHYVLNVLEPIDQTAVLMNVSQQLKPSGVAYFTVRRDVKYQGYRLHKKHHKNTFQCNVVLPFKSVFHNEFCEIYEYRHYTELNKGKVEVSPFFADNDNKVLIVESASAFSIFDKFPLNKGHALVIPKRLVADYFELTQKEQTACWLMVNQVKSILEKRFNPDGFNIGINSGAAAGQTVPHMHIHIIPRHYGDVSDPRGGVRHVIPSKGNYLK